ncbi:MAG: vitamin K epoxide reductase family protein [Candidatus Vogelbacteria bacterium]|nr:vitamin K epoxide reductase family protein [Candidatus Vogelbacteria bacterium]
MDNLIYLVVSVLSIIGFAIALKIFREKQSNRPMVCPLNGKCEQVLFSKYSKFLGIPMEIWGMFFYVTNFFGYALMFLWPVFRTPQFVSVLFLLVCSGFLFSIYLTSVQTLKLKELCSWCLSSALICFSTFFLVLSTNSLAALSNMMMTYLVSASAIYSVLLVFGFVASATYEFLSIYYGAHRHVSKGEEQVLFFLNDITLVMIGGAVIFNYIFYHFDHSSLGSSPQFITKIVILAVLLILHLACNTYALIRQYLGGVSLLSWGFIIFLEINGSQSIFIFQYILIFLVLAGIVVVVSPKVRA